MERSLVKQHSDPSAHAETSCIRNACKELRILDLDGYVLYGTLEPCGMCLSCAVWANIPEIYFGAYRKDVAGNLYEIKNWDAEQAAHTYALQSGKRLKVTGGILRNECAMLLYTYKNWRRAAP